jgi:hypothetical protein
MIKPTLGDTLYITTSGNDSRMGHGYDVNERILILKVCDEGTPYEHYQAKSLDRAREYWFVGADDLAKKPTEVQQV